jgi:hypothetical protein
MCQPYTRLIDLTRGSKDFAVVEHSLSGRVSRGEAATVSGYATRGKMPSPDSYIGATQVWRAETIRAWAASRPRKPKR